MLNKVAQRKVVRLVSLRVQELTAKNSRVVKIIGENAGRSGLVMWVGVAANTFHVRLDGATKLTTFCNPDEWSKLGPPEGTVPRGS